MTKYHKRVVQLIKDANPKAAVCCQIAHAGTNGGAEHKLDINTATEAEIRELIHDFAQAARRAEEAGYDMVQIHSAHTYFLSQSISDYYNKRTDQYRASDFLVLAKVLEAVKGAVKIPVGVKLQCDDFLEGYTMNAEQAVKIVSTLAFDFVEISGGGFSNPPAAKTTIRKGTEDHYYYRHIVEAFRNAGLLEKQPVICTGGFASAKEAEEALGDGCAMVGFSRKWLRND